MVNILSNVFAACAMVVIVPLYLGLYLPLKFCWLTLVVVARLVWRVLYFLFGLLGLAYGFFNVADPATCIILLPLLPFILVWWLVKKLCAGVYRACVGAGRV